MPKDKGYGEEKKGESMHKNIRKDDQNAGASDKKGEAGKKEEKK